MDIWIGPSPFHVHMVFGYPLSFIPSIEWDDVWWHFDAEAATAEVFQRENESEGSFWRAWRPSKTIFYTKLGSQGRKRQFLVVAENEKPPKKDALH